MRTIRCMVFPYSQLSPSLTLIENNSTITFLQICNSFVVCHLPITLVPLIILLTTIKHQVKKPYCSKRFPL